MHPIDPHRPRYHFLPPAEWMEARLLALDAWEMHGIW